MLALTSDGLGVLDGHREKFELTEREQDQLCDRLFPRDSVVRNAYLTRKRQKSYTGHHVDLANVSKLPSGSEAVQLSVDEEKIVALGGVRLLTLFLTGMNFGLAARELSVEESALRKWFSRWRSGALDKGLRPEDLLN